MRVKLRPRWFPGHAQCTLFMVLYLNRTCMCGLHAVVWSYIGILNYAPPRCRTSQYHMTFISLSVSLWNFCDPKFDGVGLAGYESRVNVFFVVRTLFVFYTLFRCFPFLFFLSIGWFCGAGVFGLTRCNPLTPIFELPTMFR